MQLLQHPGGLGITHYGGPDAPQVIEEEWPVASPLARSG